MNCAWTAVAAPTPVPRGNGSRQQGYVEYSACRNQEAWVSILAFLSMKQFCKIMARHNQCSRLWPA